MVNEEQQNREGQVKNTDNTTSSESLQKLTDIESPAPKAGAEHQIVTSNENEQKIESVENAIVTKAPEAVRQAIERLREDLFALDEKPNNITLLMAVDVGTARATLVPIATVENMRKFNRYLGQLPEGVQSAILKNIPKEDLEDSELIWNYLGTVKELNKENYHCALPEMPSTEKNEKSRKNKKGKSQS